jgi:hypothetical protein
MHCHLPLRYTDIPFYFGTIYVIKAAIQKVEALLVAAVVEVRF